MRGVVITLRSGEQIVVDERFPIRIPRPVPKLRDGGWATYVGPDGNLGLARGQLVSELQYEGNGRWTGVVRMNGHRFSMEFGSYDIAPMGV